MPIRNSKALTGKGAHLIMDAALAKARELGIAATIAIVDAGVTSSCWSGWRGPPFTPFTVPRPRRSAPPPTGGPPGRGAPGTAPGGCPGYFPHLASRGRKTGRRSTAAGPIMVDKECLGRDRRERRHPATGRGDRRGSPGGTGDPGPK